MTEEKGMMGKRWDLDFTYRWVEIWKSMDMIERKKMGTSI